MGVKSRGVVVNLVRAGSAEGIPHVPGKFDVT